MRVVLRWLLVPVALFMAGASLAEAQSLGDVARKEEARRKALQAEKDAEDAKDAKDADGKVYTNKDLKPARTGQSAPAASSDPAAAAPAAEAEKEPPNDASAAAAPAADAGPAKVKNQEYWAGRMKELRAALDRDQLFAEALQTRINSLTADFTARDDPAQRDVIAADRQKSLDTLEQVRTQIENGRKAIAALEEEARRAGVPPGWLR